MVRRRDQSLLGAGLGRDGSAAAGAVVRGFSPGNRCRVRRGRSGIPAVRHCLSLTFHLPSHCFSLTYFFTAVRSSVSIPDTRTEGGYTTFYLLRCRTPAEREWGVAKRFSEFAELQRRTTAEVPGLKVLAFPVKSSWFGFGFGAGGNEAAVVADRAEVLEAWLNSVLTLHPTSKDVAMFLAEDGSWALPPELEPASSSSSAPESPPELEPAAETGAARTQSSPARLSAAELDSEEADFDPRAALRPADAVGAGAAVATAESKLNIPIAFDLIDAEFERLVVAGE